MKIPIQGKNTKQFLTANLNKLIPIDSPGPGSKVLWLSLGWFVITSILVVFFWQNLPNQIPLFYSKPWGEEQLAAREFIPLPFLLATVFLFVNLVFAGRIGVDFLQKTLILGAGLGVTLAAVTIIRILFLLV